MYDSTCFSLESIILSIPPPSSFSPSPYCTLLSHIPHLPAFECLKIEIVVHVFGYGDVLLERYLCHTVMCCSFCWHFASLWVTVILKWRALIYLLIRFIASVLMSCLCLHSETLTVSVFVDYNVYLTIA